MQAIDDKLVELRQQLRDVENAEQRVRDELEQAVNAVRETRKMIALLEHLKSQSRSTPRERKPKPSQAIRMLVAQHPGISLKEILDTLDGKVETSSADARHLLRTTVNNLVRDGKITRHPDDLYSVPNYR